MAKFSSKQPFEEYYVAIDFTNVIGSATVASATVVAYDSSLATVTTNLIDTSKQTVTSPNVYIWVRGGQTGQDYKITCQITTSIGEKFEQDVTLPVEEK